ncbi:MAG TPA: hypothetical protein VIO95_03120, partial [Mycobacterium sp.]
SSPALTCRYADLRGVSGPDFRHDFTHRVLRGGAVGARLIDGLLSWVNDMAMTWELTWLQRHGGTGRTP